MPPLPNIAVISYDPSCCPMVMTIGVGGDYRHAEALQQIKGRNGVFGELRLSALSKHEAIWKALSSDPRLRSPEQIGRHSARPRNIRAMRTSQRRSYTVLIAWNR